MKHFLIKYRFRGDSEAEWRAEVARFIEALDTDPDLKGKIAYRCMRRGGDYYHLATATDDDAVSVLQGKDFFKHYTQMTGRACGGEVEAGPIEIIAETGIRL